MNVVVVPFFVYICGLVKDRTMLLFIHICRH